MKVSILEGMVCVTSRAAVPTSGSRILRADGLSRVGSLTPEVTGGGIRTPVPVGGVCWLLEGGVRLEVEPALSAVGLEGRSLVMVGIGWLAGAGVKEAVSPVAVVAGSDVGVGERP